MSRVSCRSAKQSGAQTHTSCPRHVLPTPELPDVAPWHRQQSSTASRAYRSVVVWHKRRLASLM